MEIVGLCNSSICTYTPQGGYGHKLHSLSVRWGTASSGLHRPLLLHSAPCSSFRRSLLRLAALSSTTMAFSTSRCGSLRHGVAQRFRWRHLVGMRPPWFGPTPPASGAGRPAGSECRSGSEAQAQHTNQHPATAHAAAGSTSTTNDITQAGVRGPPDWLTDLLLLAREGRSCDRDGGAGREARLDGQLPHADPATGGVPAIRDVTDTQTDRQTDTHGETK